MNTQPNAANVPEAPETRFGLGSRGLAPCTGQAGFGHFAADTRQKDPLNVTVSTGFSLVEMLVVLVIIFVLAALLFPSAKGWIDRAKAAKCTSNLRQVGVAVRLAASDNNGRWVVFDETQLYGRWDYDLIKNNYLGSNCAFCPGCKPPTAYTAFKTYGVTWMGTANLPDDKNIIVTDTWPSSMSRSRYEIKLMAISKPSQYVLMADSYTTRSGNGQYHIIGNSSMDEIHMRHQHLANILFADGHVEALGTNGLAGVGYHRAFNSQGVITNF